jgi:hypothetical protein
MDLCVAWRDGSVGLTASWWRPSRATPLGDVVLAVPLSALAARGRVRTGVSVETATAAMRAVTARFGVLALSEALRCDGRDYMRECAGIDVRAACFPTAHPADAPASGHAVSVVPVALLPALLACFSRAWQPAREPGAVATLAADIMARLPQDPALAYRRNHRILSYIVCCDTSTLSVDEDLGATTPPPVSVDVLDGARLERLVIDMLLARNYAVDVCCTRVANDAQALLAALASGPLRVRVVNES